MMVLALVSITFFMFIGFAIIIGQVILYKEFPRELRPGRFSFVVLGAGFFFYAYIIIQALMSFFGGMA